MKRSSTPATHLAMPAVAALLAAVLAIGCASPDPAAPAASVGPSPASSAAASPVPSAAPTAAASPAVSPSGTGLDRPDLAAVRVSVEPLAGGLDQPVFVTNAGDGSGRLFVAEQPGRIRIIENGEVSPAPFLDITDRVTSGGERGLLGFAFPPGFGPARPAVYVHYSGADGATVISEFRLDAEDTTRLDPASERVILTEPQPYPNHNGGWIGFDATGMLLIGLGDGGSGGDPENRASDLGTILGKMLRIDVRGTPLGGELAYAIPADNPYVGRSDARPEILHSGLRNPFRSSIDPATGNLWIGDVGPERVGGGRHRAGRRARPRLRLAALGGPALLRPGDRLRSGRGHDARDGVRARGRMLGHRRGRLPRPGGPGAAGRVPVR